MRETDITPDHKYIEIQYSEGAQEFLREYCQENGFDLEVKFNGKSQAPEDFDFHTTVWFTANAVILPNSSKSININDIEPKGFTLFGPESNILVMEIDSEQIRSVRDAFGTEYGLQDTYPDYRPHITMSYSYQGDLPQIELPRGDLLIGSTLNVKSQKS
jgi:hypothetical protein